MSDRDVFVDGAAEIARKYFDAEGNLKDDAVRILVVPAKIVAQIYDMKKDVLTDSAVKLVRSLYTQVGLSIGDITSLLLAASTTGIADLYFSSEEGATAQDLRNVATGLGGVCVAMMNSAEQLMSLAEHAQAEAEFALKPTIN